MKNSRGAHKMLKGMINAVEDLQRYILNKPNFASNHKQRERTFQYLQNAGYIKPTGKKSQFSLTDLGKINMLYELVKKRKPDGRTRAVIFDIPEKIRGKRNVLRHHLQELGFKMKQQSVWSSDIPCDDLIRLVVKHHKLGRYTALIVGKVLQLDRRPSFIR